MPPVNANQSVKGAATKTVVLQRDPQWPHCDIQDSFVNLSSDKTKAVVETVKPFNIKNGYGVINRNHTRQNIFVHHIAVTWSNTHKNKRSVGERETIELGVVVGEKGREPVSVTGPDGKPVQGST